MTAAANAALAVPTAAITTRVFMVGGSFALGAFEAASHWDRRPAALSSVASVQHACDVCY
ncbi:hypothetical protein MSIM_34420 [Mycobacterium simiae]|nr:hypothetical protein MSIM_34420 [Mycobacterium simiae]